jgi:hypothetical protein
MKVSRTNRSKQLKQNSKNKAAIGGTPEQNSRTRQLEQFR